MFYGGEIVCIQGQITLEGLGIILDLIDEYIGIREAVEEEDNVKTSL